MTEDRRFPAAQTITYVYNAAGDRTEVINGGTTTSYTSNADNEITQVGSADVYLRRQRQPASVTNGSGTTTYTYNDLNQLVSIADSRRQRTNFQYSPLGFLVGDECQRARRRITWSIRPGWATWWPSYSGSSLIANYIYGPGLVSQTGPSGTGYYDFDGSSNTDRHHRVQRRLRQPVQLLAFRRDDDHFGGTAQPVHVRRAGRRDADRQRTCPRCGPASTRPRRAVL